MSHHPAVHIHVEEKGPEYEVTNIIKVIHEWSDVSRLDALICVAGALTIEEVQHQVHISRLTLPQNVAFGLALPIHRDNPELYGFLYDLVISLEEIPDPFRPALSIRLVKCAIASGKADSLFELNLLQELNARFTGYQYPLYLLSAHTTTPVAYDPVFTGELLLDTMAFYYAGWLKLFVSDFDAGDWLFQCAWLLSGGAKSIREPIVTAMSLSAFLTHKSRAIFEGRIPHKHRPREGIAKDLWNLGELPGGEWPRHFERLRAEIADEFARRVLIDLADSVKVISIDELTGMCGVRDHGEMEWLLAECRDVQAVVADDRVYLEGFVLEPQVEAEIAQLSKEIGVPPPDSEPISV
jgi:hypothetical protein